MLKSLSIRRGFSFSMQRDSFYFPRMKSQDRHWYFSAILVAFCWVWLALINKYAADDFAFIQTVRKYGIWDGMLQHFNYWNTRWASILWANLWFNCFVVPAWLNVCTFLFIFCCIYLFINRLIILYEAKDQLILVIASLVTLFFLTPGKADTWFWATTTTMYAWPLGFAMLALSIMIQPNRTWGSKMLEWTILLIAGLYCGGSSEPSVVLQLVWIGIFFFLKNFRGEGFRFFRFKEAFIYLLALMAGFLIAYSGGGHTIRQAAMPNYSIEIKVMKSIYYSFQFILYFIIPWFPVAFLWMLPWYRKGLELSTKRPVSTSMNRFLVLQLILLLLSIWVQSFCMVWIMGEAGPARAWSGLALLLSIQMAWTALEFGRRKIQAPIMDRILNRSGPLLLFLTGSILLIKTYQSMVSIQLIQEIVEVPLEIGSPWLHP